LTDSSKWIYVAAPLFSEAQRTFLECLVSFVSNKIDLDPVKDFFLPHRDAGDLGIVKGQTTIFESDIIQLDVARIVIAVLDGPDVDGGTAAEIGYAFSKRKPIFGLLTDFRAYAFEKGQVWRLNNMIWGMCDQGKRIFGKKEELSMAVKSYLEEQQWINH